MLMEVVGLLGILGMFSIEDIKKKEISVVGLAAAGVTGVLLHLYFSRISIWSVLGGIAIGVAMYLISVLSGEQIGKGDALLMAVTGIYLGFWGNIILLWIASVLAGIGGMAALILFNKKRGYEIPFIPFVFIAYIGCLIIWKGQLL